jgi:hypothetical protein
MLPRQMRFTEGSVRVHREELEGSLERPRWVRDFLQHGNPQYSSSARLPPRRFAFEFAPWVLRRKVRRSDAPVGELARRDGRDEDPPASVPRRGAESSRNYLAAPPKHPGDSVLKFDKPIRHGRGPIFHRGPQQRLIEKDVHAALAASRGRDSVMPTRSVRRFRFPRFRPPGLIAEPPAQSSGEK